MHPAVFYCQGDEGHYFYIIKEGKADCFQTDAAGDQKLVASLSGGNYFGEIALLTPKPRQATVKANVRIIIFAYFCVLSTDDCVCTLYYLF
ncbi:cyclic nucleotide-binding domain-containing protein [archaeon]|nr:MAG: cyclic nucleotide-binding domain-containing protein [archaeon]